MAILGNKNSLIDKDLEQKNEYTIPAMVRNGDEKEMSLKKSIFLSAILHPAVVGAVWLLIFILALMGITLSIFDRPKPKMNDIEFVLVDNAKNQMPVNKKTPNRSDRNTRTGGKKDPKKKVSMPSPTPAKKSIQEKPEPKAQKQTVQKKVTKSVQPKQNILQSLMHKAPEARPQPPSTRPQVRPSLKPPSMPKLSAKPTSPFAIPVAKPTGPTGRTYSTGPIGGSGTARSCGSSSSR